MRFPQRLSFEWRFSLSEIMVAVAIDAVLVAAIGDLTRIRYDRSDKPFVYNTLLVVTYLVVPLFVVPLYGITRRLRTSWALRWHNRLNDLLMAIDFPLVAGAWLQPVLYPLRDRGIALIILIIPVGFTLFLIYSLCVQALRNSGPAAEEIAVAPANDAATESPPPEKARGELPAGSSRNA